MRKLYKTINGRVKYWEAWQRDRDVVVHTGWLGHGGKHETHAMELGEADHAAIARVVVPILAEGYEPIARDELHLLVVQKSLRTWGSADDVELRTRIETIANDCLGWTGNGYADGGDLGSGTLNIFCFVVEPVLAVKTLTAQLRKAKLLGDVTIAYSSTSTLTGKVRVGYPPRRRKFSILGTPALARKAAAPRKRAKPRARKQPKRRR